MASTLTSEASRLLLERAELSIQTNAGHGFSHERTANTAPVVLGGLWRGHVISAADIQEARKEMWTSLEAEE